MPTDLPSKYPKANAAPKHLGGYSVESYHGYTRQSFNAIIDDVDLHETYLPGWRAAVVQAGVTGAMCSYNAINGTPMCANSDVLNGWMREQWNFSGFVISDASAVRKIFMVRAYESSELAMLVASAV